MQGLDEFTYNISGLGQWQHTQKIKFFAWYMHMHLAHDRFHRADILACYEALHLEKPANISQLVRNMMDKKPREVMQDTRGYYLERGVREQLNTKYGQRVVTITVHKLLQELPAKIPNTKNRVFLNEALICFKNGAFRAAIVMCWNLGYNCLCEYVIENHLGAFNAQLPKSFPKARVSVIVNRDDFSEMKESETLQVCRSANIITADQLKILKEKLDRRNTASHPNNIIITQLQAEDFITDLINNIVLKLL